MSYGNWNARSPEDVQRINGRATDGYYGSISSLTVMEIAQ